MSESRKFAKDVRTMFREHPDDPAVQVFRRRLLIFIIGAKIGSQDFLSKLKTHLLGRLLGTVYDGDEEDYSPDDLNDVRIVENRIYAVKSLRVNFTRYDVHRDQDVMNPRTHSDIMVYSCDDGNHPYWYARVLGIFHTRVKHVGPRSVSGCIQSMQFLWIRWFGLVPHQEYKFGIKMARLPKVGFVEGSDAFGFLNPSSVIRGCHLIPSFSDGQTLNLLPYHPSLGRGVDEAFDWARFYVNMYVVSLSSPLVN